MIQSLKNISSLLGLNYAQDNQKDDDRGSNKTEPSVNTTDNGRSASSTTSNEHSQTGLSIDDLDAMYVACNFEQAWKPSKHSPWCSVFNTEQLKIMEYREDLEYYWVDGPHFPVTYEQACVLLADVYLNFLNVTKESMNEEKGIFYFTHSGTLLKLLAFLEVF